MVYSSCQVRNFCLLSIAIYSDVYNTIITTVTYHYSHSHLYVASEASNPTNTIEKLKSGDKTDKSVNMM